MKIQGIELLHVRMPLKKAFETSFGVERDRDCLLVSVSSNGLIGWGECVAGDFPGYSYETVGTAWVILRDYLIPALIGTTFEDVSPILPILGSVKGHPMAKAGLELACWDLVGKLQQKSLREMLGAERLRVPVGVSVGIQPDVDALLEEVDQFRQMGYARVKVKIKPGRDLHELEAVRKRFPDLPLMADANASYTLEEMDRLQAMDPLDLLMIEQPFAEDDLIDHSQLQERLTTPLCLDESIHSLRHARQALDIDACRVINIKPGRVGGLTEAIAIHDYCLDREVPVWCGGMLETAVGRSANLALSSLPGFQYPGDLSATDRYYNQDIGLPTFSLNADSTIDVPSEPGLGVHIQRQWLEEFTLRKMEISG